MNTKELEQKYGVPYKYIEYPHKVLNNDIMSCEYIKLACKRYLSWFSLDDRYFDTKAVDKVVNFASKLKHSSGSYKGKPFILSDWQFWIVCAMYGFKWKKDNLRCIRTAEIELARKGGKSSLVSMLALYHLCADGEGESQCIFAANSAAQAQLCFTMAKNYISTVDPKGKYFKQYRSEIRFPLTKSSLKVVSADASKLDGLNCSFYVCDEMHEADGTVWNVLDSSTGFRSQPMSIAISTAGFHLEGFYYQMRKSNIEVLYDKVQNDSLFVAIYTLDEGDNIEDTNLYKKCQPNLGITVKEEYMKQQLLNAKINPSLMTNFKTKILNIWCASAVGEWIPSEYILKCTDKVNLEDWKHTTCYLGLDLSSVSDMTAISVMVFDSVKQQYLFKNWYFLPQSALEESSNREKYKVWNKQKFLQLTSGNVVDYDEVIKKIQQINLIVPIQAIAYDSWQSTAIIIKLTELGFNCVPYSQSIGSMNRPTRHIEMIARNGHLIIDDNPITRWMFANCELKEDWNNNAKVQKRNKCSENKIDGIAAACNALGHYLTETHYDNVICGLKIES